MKQATIYLRGTKYFVQASSRTTDGVWIASPPFIAIDSSSTDRDLGVAIQKALEGSRTDVPHPRIWKGLIDPLLALAGVKTWKAFSKDASCAGVEQDDSSFTVTPTRNLGPDDGFEEDASRQVRLERLTPDALGAVARQCLTTAP